MTIQDQIIAIADQIGGQVRLDYSGRGMFGAKCMGIVCTSATEAIEAAARWGIRGAQRDSMGKRAIVYWPNIKAAGTSQRVTGQSYAPSPVVIGTMGSCGVGIAPEATPADYKPQLMDFARSVEIQANGDLSAEAFRDYMRTMASKILNNP
jgi:hypothetical protein